MRALVVDESKPARSIVVRMLQGLNFACTEAGHGAEALAAITASGRPDLLTVNWHMPVMDGLELVKRLRSDPAHRGLPILMISTEHEQAQIAVAREAGITDYLAKPFTAAALARKLVALGLVAEEAAHPGGRAPIGVLICDDSATIRGILSATLGTDPDVKVVGTAINGAACLDAIAATRPDLVLLDVEMPVMDGLTALREIRRRFGKLPVVMFSSLTERGAKATVDALLGGANDYVAKPAGLDPGEVAARIRTDVIGKIKSLVPRSAAADRGLAGRALRWRRSGDRRGASGFRRSSLRFLPAVPRPWSRCCQPSFPTPACRCSSSSTCPPYSPPTSRSGWRRRADSRSARRWTGRSPGLERCSSPRAVGISN